MISAYVALRFEWKFSIPVLIALAHDLLITSGVYALTGRQVTTATVAALLTILGYSMYDTIIVFDRVRENIPRMPRAAFSPDRQPIDVRGADPVDRHDVVHADADHRAAFVRRHAGSTELTDFAFALLIGVASGAYSSIFIASPVLTHWKERESQYRHRRERIESRVRLRARLRRTAADVEPVPRRVRRGRAADRARRPTACPRPSSSR